ncbi:MAG: N-acetyltransferase family protein [Anaerolineae bacterium]
MRIREASIEDSAIIAQLMAQLIEASGYEDWQVSPEQIEESLRKMADSDNYQVLLAEDEGQVVGLLSLSFRHTLFHPAPSALIDELVVERGHRRRGVGQQLMAEAIERCRAAGCCEIEVSTERSNEAAQKFYRQHGFSHEAILFELEFEEDGN